MKFAIVDDVSQDRLLLNSYINKYCADNNLLVEIDMFGTGKSFLAAAKSEKYEIVFLDIYIGEDENGIDVAASFRAFDEKNLIIFSTTSEHHAIKSFRVRAFDYLLKPYTYLQFEEVMNLCRKSILQKALFIDVKEGRDTTQVVLSDIVYVDYYNHYVQLHTKEMTVRTYMSFPEFYEKIKDDKRFLYCYRNCAVNMDEVSSISDTEFITTTGDLVPISKPNRREIKKLYAEYTFSKMEEGL